MMFQTTAAAIAVLMLATATPTRAQVSSSCVDLVQDELCLELNFPTCQATFNGVACDSCVFCGEEADSATAYSCEVAALFASTDNEGNVDADDDPTCNNECVNVECGSGCVGCKIAPEDVPAALEAFEAAAQPEAEEGEGETDKGDKEDDMEDMEDMEAISDMGDDEDAVMEATSVPAPEGDFPIPAPAPEGDFPVPVPVPGELPAVDDSTTNTNETMTSTTEGEAAGSDTDTASADDSGGETTEAENADDSGAATGHALFTLSSLFVLAFLVL